MSILKHATRMGVAGALAFAGGCDLLGPDACTLIGCSSGLTVALQGQLTGAYRVEVRAPGAATAHVFECPEATQCAGVVLFDEFMPSVATVTVTTERGTVRQQIQPTYVTSRPNGKDCKPLCRHATVQVPIPT